MAAAGLAKTSVEVADFVFPALLALLLLGQIKRLPRGQRDLIPYILWRQTLSLMGLVFLALSFCQLFVKVPFDFNALTAIYLVAMVIIGILPFAYKRRRGHRLFPHALAAAVTRCCYRGRRKGIQRQW